MRSGITVLLSAVALATMGAGPCDMLGMLDDGPDGGEDCPATPCADQLDVRIIRADNDGFWPGQYRFAIGLTGGVVYAVDCWLAHEEAGFDCTLGDTTVLFPFLEIDAGAIWLVVAGAPERLVVAVEYGGMLLGERELAPSYDEFNPGGPGCPVCLVGWDSMAVAGW